MKKALFLALAVCLTLTVQLAAAASTQPAAEEVYSAMTALKSQYPEGTPWTNDNRYDWHGGIYRGGYGCAGFAFMLSDAAFGSLPARKLETFSYSDVRTGDILRLSNGTHSVIVLEIYPDHVVIAEGNYNKSVHWGRTVTKDEAEQSAYLMTRYPEAAADPSSVGPEPAVHTVTVEDIPASGAAKASTQTVTVDGKKVEFQMYALLDANGNGTNYIKLRDMAQVLNGTKAQFSVGYDGTISLTTGEAYASTGTEMTTPFSGDRAYTGGAQSIKINGSAVDMTAITLLDDAGGGYNYFKLRDLGKALGFNVGYSNEQGVFIESGKPYAG